MDEAALARGPNRLAAALQGDVAPSVEGSSCRAGRFELAGATGRLQIFPADDRARPPDRARPQQLLSSLAVELPGVDEHGRIYVRNHARRVETLDFGVIQPP